MTKGELIKSLQESSAPDDMRISLVIADPKCSAHTNDIVNIAAYDGHLVIKGWASEENEDSFAPWW